MYTYIVQEGDTLLSIVKDQNLGDNGLILIYMLNGSNIDPLHPENLQIGQTITLPYPGQPIPTPTSLPTGLAAGTKIVYRVMPGNSLGFIAGQFNTTAEAIVAANKTILTDGINSMIYPGQLLQVPDQPCHRNSNQDAYPYINTPGHTLGGSGKTGLTSEVYSPRLCNGVLRRDFGSLF